MTYQSCLDKKTTYLFSPSCRSDSLAVALVEMKVKVVQSHLTLCNPMTLACQAPLSMEFSRQEYWSG